MEEMLQTYRVPLIGAGIGLVLAVLFMILGFFKTFLVILLTGLGFYLALKFVQSGMYDSMKKRFNKEKGNSN